MTNPFAKVPLKALTDERLKDRELRVLIALYSFVNGNTGECYPSHEQIADRCKGIRAKDVSCITKRLVELGWISKTGNGGRSSRANYTLETTPKSGVVKENKPPRNLGLNHPEIRAKTTPKSGVGNKQTNKQTINRPGKTAKKPSWQIPDWINAQAWADFEQHRKDIRKPLTDMARTKSANALQILNHAEQQACVDLTIQNRWTGLFPEKHRGKHAAHKPDSRQAIADKINREGQAAIERELGGRLIRQAASDVPEPLDFPVPDRGAGGYGEAGMGAGIGGVGWRPNQSRPELLPREIGMAAFDCRVSQGRTWEH